MLAIKAPSTLSHTVALTNRFSPLSASSPRITETTPRRSVHQRVTVPSASAIQPPTHAATMPRTRANADIPVGSIRPNVVLPAESVIRLSPPQYRYSAYGTTMTANRIVARPSLKVSFISHLLLPQVPASVLDRPGSEVT